MDAAYGAGQYHQEQSQGAREKLYSTLHDIIFSPFMLDLDAATILSRVIILIIAFTVHEFAHAFVANAFGDETPRLNGRLTLNPISHLDPMGSLLLVVAGFGWAKPVPINPYVLRQRSRSAVMWVSLAGPLSNLVMAILAVLPVRFGLVSMSSVPGRFFPSPIEFIVEFVAINLLLFVFNLLPISPLDGEKVLEYFIPPRASAFFERIRPYGPVILMVVVFVLPYLGINIIGGLLRFIAGIFFSVFLG